MAKRKKSKPSSLYSRFLNLDMFGSSISFSINGKRTYDTFCGAMVTLIVLATVLCYSQYKVREYFAQSYAVQSRIERAYFGSDPLKVS